ncbi:MAG TPA: alkyl sulfatase dimerization domain-containing protein [Pedomonas sp.]
MNIQTFLRSGAYALLAAGSIAAAPVSPVSAESATELQVPYSAPANYIAHGKMFQERVTRVGNAPVWQIEFHGQNLVVIQGQDGLILVDTGMNRELATRALAKIRKEIGTQPVKAIIYTHHHTDHINGAAVFADPQDVASGAVPVFAASNFLKELADEGVATVPIVAARSAYMFGFALEGQEAADYHVGCCGRLGTASANTSGYIAPTQFVDVDGARDVEIAGVRMHLFHTGGEAASHIAVWLPDHRTLISGDEVQGPTFPQLHSMRGTKMRDAPRWVEALRRMQAFDAEHMVPLHGPVVSGTQRVKSLLSKYEDAIQYTHDQTIRLINKGLTVRELPEALDELPPFLRSDPYTGEYYGTVPDSARSYYVGYISWFSGDATELDPTPPIEAAQRTVELMGGRDRVLAAAMNAFKAGDAQWAAELTTPLIRINHEDMEARKIKAAAFRKLGYATDNSSRRGFYLMGAKELDGSLNRQNLTQRYVSADYVKRLPVPAMLQTLRFRVDPTRAGDADAKVRLNLGADGNWLLHLRNSTLKAVQLKDAPALDTPEAALDRAALAQLVSGSPVSGLVKAGQVTGAGADALERILSTVDFKAEPINLVVR